MELDESGLVELTILELNKQRRLVLLIFTVTHVIGLMLLSFLIIL